MRGGGLRGGVVTFWVKWWLTAHRRGQRHVGADVFKNEIGRRELFQPEAGFFAGLAELIVRSQNHQDIHARLSIEVVVRWVAVRTINVTVRGRLVADEGHQKCALLTVLSVRWETISAIGLRHAYQSAQTTHWRGAHAPNGAVELKSIRNGCFTTAMEKCMKGYVQNLESIAVKNGAFRQVLYTAKNCQLVVMALAPHEEIGSEVHRLDQFFRIEAGSGDAILDGVTTPIQAGFAVIVPAGTTHNIINTGSAPMRLYTLYAPPNHRDGVVHRTRADALADNERFDGATTE
jgi:mannose-6-phosphate isomerase-like protein (cupin superfamily)